MSGHQRIVYLSESSREIAQIAQGGYGVSILGDAQKTSGHGSGQLALAPPDQSGHLDQMTSRGTSNHNQFVICDNSFLTHSTYVDKTTVSHLRDPSLDPNLNHDSW